MARTRDSIYNVSSDIRLEDYTDGSGGGGSKLGKIARIAGIVLLGLLLLWGGRGLFEWLFGPDYRLAIANEFIDANNVDTYDGGDEVTVNSSAPVYIRFDWEEEELKTDYLRIEITADKDGKQEKEAALERRPPQTAKYIFFMGPVDPGHYHVRVLNRENEELMARDMRVN